MPLRLLLIILLPDTAPLHCLYQTAGKFFLSKFTSFSLIIKAINYSLCLAHQLLKEFIFNLAIALQIRKLYFRMANIGNTYNNT